MHRLICCAAFFGGLIASTVHDASAQEQEQTSGQVASTDIVVEGAILKTIESTTLTAQVAGILQELHVKEGSAAETAQMLGKVQDESVRLKLEQLKTQIEMSRKKQANDIDYRLAEKARQVAQNEYQRAVRANSLVPDTYPLNEIDRLKLVADQAQLEVERALYEQEMAGFEVELATGEYRQTLDLLTRHQITSPVSGVVVSIEKRRGEWVEPGVELLRIVRIDRLRIEGFVSAKDAMRELVGTKASVKPIGNGEYPALPAEVVFVSPDVNPVNSQVRVFLEVDNSNNSLRPGLRVEAIIAQSK